MIKKFNKMEINPEIVSSVRFSDLSVDKTNHCSHIEKTILLKLKLSNRYCGIGIRYATQYTNLSFVSTTYNWQNDLLNSEVRTNI